MGEQTIFDPEKFLFRDLHPLVSIGTASDRYKGWVGQIYSQDLYAGRIKARTNRVGKNSFRDEILPIDCVREYFQHFRILEIDYTFYAPLVEKEIPTPCAKTLGQYAMFLGTGDGVFLKAPQMFFAQKLRRGKDYIRNENYLAPEPFFRQFYQPAVGILGDNLRGIIFEQEYQRFGDRPRPRRLQPISTASLPPFPLIPGTMSSCERKHTFANRFLRSCESMESGRCYPTGPGFPT